MCYVFSVVLILLSGNSPQGVYCFSTAIIFKVSEDGVPRLHIYVVYKWFCVVQLFGSWSEAHFT